MSAKKKILIVVDMQNDFVTGKLGNEMTKALLPKIVKKMKEHGNDYSTIYFTRDIHFDNYLSTLEGQRLPVEHCIKGSGGESIVKELWDVVKDLRGQKKFIKVVDKHGFVSKNLVDYLSCTCGSEDEIEICGLFTDMCVISNAIAIRTELPNTVIKVDARCCVGSSPKAHNAALRTMDSCFIDVIGKQYGKKADETTESNETTDKTNEPVVEENNNN